MIMNSHSRPCQKSSCSVKLDYLTITLQEYLRRISLKWNILKFSYIYKLSYLVSYALKTNSDFAKRKKRKLLILVTCCRTTVLQNNFQCLLLNIQINAPKDIFRFVRNENRKSEHTGIKRKKIWKKIKRKNWWAVLIII